MDFICFYGTVIIHSTSTGISSNGDGLARLVVAFHVEFLMTELINSNPSTEKCLYNEHECFQNVGVFL